MGEIKKIKLLKILCFLTIHKWGITKNCGSIHWICYKCERCEKKDHFHWCEKIKQPNNKNEKI